jgi:hypothetical protein
MEGVTAHPASVTTELDRALRIIERWIRDGVEHGHFEFAIRCDLTTGGKRRLTFVGGKSHQFVIRPEELEEGRTK